MTNLFRTSILIALAYFVAAGPSRADSFATVGDFDGDGSQETAVYSEGKIEFLRVREEISVNINNDYLVADPVAFEINFREEDEPGSVIAVNINNDYRVVHLTAGDIDGDERDEILLLSEREGGGLAVLVVKSPR